VAAEINRLVAEEDPHLLSLPSVSVGMAPATCPTDKSLEDLFYPDVRMLVDEVSKLHHGSHAHDIPLPDSQSMVDYYKHFRGPF